MDLRRESPDCQPVFTGRYDQLMWEMHLNLGETVPNLLAGECKDPQQGIKGQQSASLRTARLPRQNYHSTSMTRQLMKKKC